MNPAVSSTTTAISSPPHPGPVAIRGSSLPIILRPLRPEADALRSSSGQVPGMSARRRCCCSTDPIRRDVAVHHLIRIGRIVPHRVRRRGMRARSVSREDPGRSAPPAAAQQRRGRLGRWHDETAAAASEGVVVGAMDMRRRRRRREDRVWVQHRRHPRRRFHLGCCGRREEAVRSEGGRRSSTRTDMSIRGDSGRRGSGGQPLVGEGVQLTCFRLSLRRRVHHVTHNHVLLRRLPSTGTKAACSRRRCCDRHPRIHAGAHSFALAYEKCRGGRRTRLQRRFNAPSADCGEQTRSHIRRFRGGVRGHRRWRSWRVLECVLRFALERHHHSSGRLHRRTGRPFLRRSWSGGEPMRLGIRVLATLPALGPRRGRCGYYLDWW